jgi:eukaryotic-like serine/threonine-protein kinase
MPKGRKVWTLPVGFVIVDRFEIVREIGIGGMGAVFEARDRHLCRSVALKFLDPELVSDEEHVVRFQREAMAAGKIGHPNICDVLDRGVTDDGVPFIVMELLQGATLYDLIRAEGKLPPKRVVPIILEVLSALGAAHRAEIVHRDLKPENIFLVRRGDAAEGCPEQVKLLDFGVSRFLDDANVLRLTKSGRVLGTPIYVSPEQALAIRDVDHRADLWGVGVLLYEALTGRVPFHAKNTAQMLIKIIQTQVTSPRDLEPSIPAPIERVILKALTKKRADRYQDAESFAGALTAAYAESTGIRAS